MVQIVNLEVSDVLQIERTNVSYVYLKVLSVHLT